MMSSCASMFDALMTSLMTSAGRKIGQILKFLYLHECFTYSVDQNLEISEMLMAFLLVNLTSGINSDKKVCRDIKMEAI